MYTQEEKARLIEYFKADSEDRIRRLEDDCAAMASDAEAKILKRLNTVSATLWNVKVKDVLMIERHQKPSMKHLIHDIKALHAAAASGGHAGGGRPDTRSSRLPQRSVSDSRVGKPPQRPRTTSSHR
ncbi:Borealin N-terminal domain-containing protein [[Candida] zeylanoides]